MEETQVLCRFPQEMVPFYRLFCGQGTEALPKGRGHAPAAPGWPSVSSGTALKGGHTCRARGDAGVNEAWPPLPVLRQEGLKGDVDAVPRFHDHIFFPALVHETEFSGTGGFGRGLDAAVLPGQVDRKTPAGAESPWPNPPSMSRPAPGRA